jgi:UDP-glucose 4-epimerase
LPCGEVFQIATGKETIINSLARLIADIAGKDLPIIHQPERKGEIRRNYSNIDKARTMLGFEPKVELRAGLNDLWQWFNRRRGSEKGREK